MLRPVSLLPALLAVATLLGVPAAAASATPAASPASAASATVVRAVAEPEETPLGVTIDTLAPAVIPRKGPVRVTGSVTNRDDQPWTNIKLYAFLSDAPMTTTAELEAAGDTDPEAYVGRRILEPGTFDSVDRLEPGETKQYALKVPRADLPATAAGVYWFGVHALGFDSAGGDSFADGRARTFLPLVPPTRRTVDTAVVIPVRHEVRHRPDGRIANVRSWHRALSTGGALRALVDLGAAAGSRPVTWLVDPSVIDAVRRLAAGNPPRWLGPTTGSGDGGDGGSAGSGDDTGDDAGSPGPSPSPSPSGEAGADGHRPTKAEMAAAAAASAWLGRLHEGLLGNQVLTLPYGDLDVGAAHRLRPGLYEQARRRSSGPLAPWDLPTTPAVESPTGYVDPAAIRDTEPQTTVLVSDRMFDGSAPSVARAEGHTLAVSSSGAAAGGPGPDDPTTPVALRQRIVSEAALRLLAPGRPPLIVDLPSTWAPEPVASFFDGLDDLPWLELSSVATATARRGTAVDLDGLDYPDDERRAQLGPASFTAAARLARAGETLQNLLTDNDQVAGVVRDEALTDTSYSDRAHPERSRLSANVSRAWIDNRLRSVRIDAPKAVILSSGSGRFAATVTNTLDEPVTVRIRAVADRPLRVAVPADSIDLPPGSRTTVLLNASSSAIGIRSVTLQLTDVDDVPLGSSDVVAIRSNRVSDVIWLIIGTGVALLFGAIVVRLFRRIRAARS